MRIHVHLNHLGRRHFLGVIGLVERRIAFEYAPSFLKIGIPVSPYMLPPGPGLNFDDKCVFKGLFGLFADSLPDAWGTILLRHVLEREGLPSHAFSQLDHLELVGCEGWGALEYEAVCGHKAARDASDGGNESCLPRLKALACRAPECGSARGCVALPDLDRLADEAMRIMGKEGYFGDCLEELFRLSGFLGGARPKVSLVLEDGEPYIVKFRAPQDPENMGLLEHEASRAARLAGIDMPETRLLASAKGPGHFAVRRFDRRQGLKIHCHTACGLLHSASLFEMDYASCLALVSDLTRHRKDVEEMVRRMIFNVRLGNRDQHSKNVAFMLDRENRWRLAPAYDLVPCGGWRGELLAMVNGKGRDMSDGDLVKTAQARGIGERATRRIIERVEDALRDCGFEPQR